MAAAAQGGAISKRRKFVADGVFYAELNEFFQRELAEEGYSGVEVRVTPTVTDISAQNLQSFSTGPQFLTKSQSSAQPTPKKCSESKDGVFESLLHSSRSASSFPKTPCHSMRQKYRIAVSQPWPSANHYAISY